MCGASLPERPSGQRGRPRLHCETCRPKHDKAKANQRARDRAKDWPSRRKGYYVCACGKPRARNAAKCLTCHWAEHRRQMRVCEHCNRAFRPKRAVVPAQFQFNKYCSRACYFAVKRRRRRQWVCRTCATLVSRQQVRCLKCKAEAAANRAANRTQPKRKSFTCTFCHSVVTRRGGHDARWRYCSRKCQVRATHRNALLRMYFADWPEDRPIPPELVQARYLYGQAIWAFSNRREFLRHHGGVNPFDPKP